MSCLLDGSPVCLQAQLKERRGTWRFSNVHRTNTWMTKSSPWDKRRKPRCLIVINAFPLRALCIIVLGVPYLLWPQSSDWRAKAFNPHKVSVKFALSLAPSAASALWVILSKSQQRGAGRKQGSTDAVSLQPPLINPWVEEERKVHPHKGCSTLFFLLLDLRKMNLCSRRQAETKEVLQRMNGK